jgi:hypothetical protein
MTKVDPDKIRAMVRKALEEKLGLSTSFQSVPAMTTSRHTSPV